MASLLDRFKSIISKNAQQTAQQYNNAIYNWLRQNNPHYFNMAENESFSVLLFGDDDGIKDPINHDIESRLTFNIGFLVLVNQKIQLLHSIHNLNSLMHY